MKSTLTVSFICFLSSFAFGQVKFRSSENIPENIQKEVKTFLDTLYAVSVRKDTAGLYRMIYTDVYNAPSFGNDGMKHNLQAFRDYWQMSDPGNAAVWQIILDNLEAGGRMYSNSLYMMPDIHIETHGEPLDVGSMFQKRVAIRDSLPVYKSASQDALIIGYLAKSDIVFNEYFHAIGLSQGLTHISADRLKITGWVDERYLYKYDWRIGIEYIKGKWLIESFSLFE